MNREAEEARIRYLYRDLVLRGKIRLPLDAAKRLIGPDCAYHLYRYASSSEFLEERGEKDDD